MYQTLSMHQIVGSSLTSYIVHVRPRNISMHLGREPNLQPPLSTSPRDILANNNNLNSQKFRFTFYVVSATRRWISQLSGTKLHNAAHILDYLGHPVMCHPVMVHQGGDPDLHPILSVLLAYDHTSTNWKTSKLTGCGVKPNDVSMRDHASDCERSELTPYIIHDRQRDISLSKDI
jgi:hypothetical protein